MQVTQGEVGQVERALAGQRKVCGELRVGCDARERPAAFPQREQRALDVMDGLGHRGVGEPGGDRLLVLLGQLIGLEETGCAVCGSEGHAGQ